MFKVQCSMFNVQCSMFKVQCSKFNVQSSMFKVKNSPNATYYIKTSISCSIVNHHKRAIAVEFQVETVGQLHFAAIILLVDLHDCRPFEVFIHVVSDVCRDEFRRNGSDICDKTQNSLCICRKTHKKGTCRCDKSPSLWYL